jgi:hypothetical protein
MDVLAYRPEPAELCWTFGGVPPVRRVRPGTVLELWTEDAFGGRVRGPDDLVSRVVEFPFVNPQTGPFYVAAATSPSRCRLTLCTAPSGCRRPPFEATSSRSPTPTAATWTPFLVRQCLATLTGDTKRSCATWTRALARSPLPVLCSRVGPPGRVAGGSRPARIRTPARPGR